MLELTGTEQRLYDGMTRRTVLKDRRVRHGRAVAAKVAKGGANRRNSAVAQLGDHDLHGRSTAASGYVRPENGRPVRDSWRVTPDAKSLPVVRCDIYYSVDPDPRARFCRSAEAVRDDESFAASMPPNTLDLPLFAFANVFHTLPKPESLAAIPGYSKPINEVCLSSEFHAVQPAELQTAGVVATMQLSPLTDDFSSPHEMRDWYTFNADHPPLVQHWTRKLTDPAFRGRSGAKLKLTLKMPQTNTLTLVFIENEWRSYRGPKKTFTCDREINGAETEQIIVLETKDFRPISDVFKSSAEVDQFGICAHFAERGTATSPQRKWNGPVPTFIRLEWE